MLNITTDEAWAVRLRAKYGIAAPMAPPTEADNDDHYEDIEPYTENESE